jgi:hypothetical protein
MEMPHDKPTAGSQAETSRAGGLADILQNQNIDKLGEQ